VFAFRVLLIPLVSAIGVLLLLRSALSDSVISANLH
jgi:hypothetical protein